jgi:hypothetical protein
MPLPNGSRMKRAGTSATRPASRRRSKPLGADLSDQQLIDALQEADPKTYGAKGTPLEASPKNRNEIADAALREIMAAAGLKLGDPGAPRKLICGATGVKNERLAVYVIAQLSNALDLKLNVSAPEFCMIAIAMLQELRPRGLGEALLACQAIAVHNAALILLRRAGKTTPADADANVARATELMRLQLEQLRTMATISRSRRRAPEKRKSAAA